MMRSKGQFRDKIFVLKSWLTKKKFKEMDPGIAAEKYVQNTWKFMKTPMKLNIRSSLELIWNKTNIFCNHALFTQHDSWIGNISPKEDICINVNVT